MVALGDCLRTGVGSRIDAEEAFACYKRAADLGDAAGMFACGDCFRQGVGVRQDTHAAFDWYRKAASRDFPQAVLACRHMLEMRSHEELEAELRPWITDFSQYTKVRTIAHGTYGVVKLMQDP
jgi:TPR repeat protein